MPVLLVSTYDLGRQPFGLASPAAWLKRAGVDVMLRDLSRGPLGPDDVEQASRVAFYLPMHTATRLALPVMARIRSRRPALPMAAYGLYAPLNDQLLREQGVAAVFGPEAEDQLLAWATLAEQRPASSDLPRLQFITPDRAGLPALGRYAALRLPDSTAKVVGSTDTSRGCKHRCRHCPIVPVYDGRFRIVPLEVVIADVAQQVAAGAQHITFGDPDFLNGPTHARRIVESLHERFPQVSYDVTIKIEHLLRHRDVLPVLARTGCLFVTSAVESVDDEVLARLEKRHTRADFLAAVALTRDAGLTLAPTFVAFTPWTTRDAYRTLLDTVAELELVEHVAPVQWGLRLLVTHGSRLLELEDIARLVGPFDPVSLTFPWRHPDPEIDILQYTVAQLVGTRASMPRRDLFDAVSAIAGRVIGGPPRPARTTIPFLDEPWYC